MLADACPAEGADLIAAAFDQIPDGILIFDAWDRLVLWNRRMAALAPRLDLERGRRREDLMADIHALGSRGLTAVWSASADGVKVCLIRGGVGKPEQLRLAKLSLDQAVQAQSRYLAAGNHDLRQPLQALVMLVGILAARRPDGVDGQLIGRIQDAASMLESQLGNLLEISKLEAGLVEPEVAAFSLASLLDGLDLEFQEQAAAFGLRLRVVKSSLAVLSDPLLLQRILRQLLANGLQCTERGGVLLGCRRHGRVVRIEVRDSGVGIGEADRQWVFREFHSRPRSLPGRSPGMGLGLAIVGRLARLLDHQVSVSSSPGGGTVFAIAVPTAATAAGRRRPAFEFSGDSGVSNL